jgi:AcrR family transcriptional regulator
MPRTPRPTARSPRRSRRPEAPGEAGKAEVPGHVAAAWGLRTPSGRGPRPGLSLDRIVEAGLRLASTEGIGAVSMGRVAQELGAATMALYRHVAAKDDLLALMVDAAFREPPPPAAGGWRASLAAWAAAHLAVLRRHPWLVRVPIGGPPLLPNHVVWFEAGLAALARTGLREDEKVSALLLVNGFVRNEAMLEADLRASAHASGAPLHDAGAIYARRLGALVDRERFPALGAVLAARVFEGPDDASFTFGLERILDGIAVLVRRPAGRGGGR